MTVFSRSVLGIGVGMLCLAAADRSVAQANPFYAGIAQSVTYESNLFRTATGVPEVDDAFATTTLLAGINQPFGRQRFLADAAVRANFYRDNTQLDNNGYGLAARLDWEALDRLAGNVGYTTNENLARFGADNGPVLTTKNMERSQEFFARGRYGAASLMSIEAAYAHRQLDYSAVEYAYLEYKQDALSLGVLYRPSGQLTLGAAARHTEGRYPFAVQTAPGVFQEDKYKRDDFDFTANWIPTGLSTVTARISYTQEEHDAVSSRDISGFTGAVRWDYKPTGKLAFTTQYIHDNGATSSFTRYDQGGTNSIGSDSQLQNSLLFRAMYEATSKIQLELNARFLQRDLVDTFELSTGGSSTEFGSDRLGELRIGLNYAPLRTFLFGCAVGYEKRTTTTTLSYAYSAGVASCFAQFKLQ